jgi:hypothetical protein
MSPWAPAWSTRPVRPNSWFAWLDLALSALASLLASVTCCFCDDKVMVHDELDGWRVCGPPLSSPTDRLPAHACRGVCVLRSSKCLLSNHLLAYTRRGHPIAFLCRFLSLVSLCTPVLSRDRVWPANRGLRTTNARAHTNKNTPPVLHARVRTHTHTLHRSCGCRSGDGAIRGRNGVF